MIVCIPIILLQKSQLRLGQKLRILTFLCLNIFMCAFALGRHIGGMYRDRQGGFLLQMSWSTLWLHLESSVAVLMGGVTALRTVFATQDRERKRRNTNSLSSSLYYRFRRFIKRSESPYNESPSLIGPNGEFLAGPQTGGTLKGVKTFIRRFNRTAGVTTYASRDDPDYNTLDDYHSFRRLEKRDGVSESTLAFSHSGDENKYLVSQPHNSAPRTV